MAGDIELLEAWRQGDLRAGDTLFGRHFDSIHRFFRNKVDDGLEDLVQQTFMACVEGRERFRNDSSFRTYLFGAAHNLLREYYRKRKRAGDVDFATTSIVDCGAGPSTVVGRRLEYRLLLDALRRLPLDSQIVLELYYWEELSASQLGVILGIPEGTVRGRVRKAKALLRKELAQGSNRPEDIEGTIEGLEKWAAQLRAMLGSDT